MTTSKIKTCTFDREWSGQNGTVFYHTIEFENGDKGQIGTKDKLPAKIATGTEHTYELEVTEKGTKVKILQPQTGFPAKQGGFKSEPFEHKAAGYAMSYSKDLMVAGKFLNPDEMYKEADKMYNWLISKKQS